MWGCDHLSSGHTPSLRVRPLSPDPYVELLGQRHDRIHEGMHKGRAWRALYQDYHPEVELKGASPEEEESRSSPSSGATTASSTTSTSAPEYRAGEETSLCGSQTYGVLSFRGLRPPCRPFRRLET